MPQPQTRPAPRTARFGGLDGLRAIAVGLVLCYHLFPPLLPGGFLGVDVFFVMSGFLITSLLLREYELGGRIRLGAFWRRRARRLLPALGLVLLVSTALALPVGGDLLVGIGQQIAGAAFFVSNWVFIANGADYFARDTPELFRNMWSLAIEEQFYIVLPLVVLLLVRLRSRPSRAIPLAALGLASAALMFELSRAGVDPTRIYFGSDSHTFGLLLGAAMAAVLHRPEASEVLNPGPLRQLAAAAAALAGLAVLGWLAATLSEGSPASFQWGFQLATAAALLVVWAVTRPGAWVGRALDAPPLRWVGERSYGIYLWHWPLLLICAGALGPDLEWLVAPLALAATVLAAALSYRFVEQPVRRFGLRRSLRMLVRVGDHTPRRRFVAIGLAAVVAVAAPAAVVAIVTAPQQSSAAEAIARGQEALERSRAAQQADEGRSGRGERSEGASETGKTENPAPGKGSGGGAKEQSAEPAPLSPDGRDLVAVGDSVMLASLPELEAAYPGISIDAAVSRGMGTGAEIVTGLSSQGSLRGVLVVGLGTNGPVQAEDLDTIRASAGTRPVVLVNAHADRDWIPSVNQLLTDYAAAHRGVVVADWTGSVTGVPDALAGDDIHPNPSGGEIYAGSVQRALEELQSPGEGIGFGLPRR
ncbi:lipopolysaccharide modification acyltransferase [Leucobacter sp. UCD-THU]|uniref:acyltransferase family protein n=1 Tax=Leucobacter sp. UCD-THU TaxID=1292023 RepID=UPI00036C8C9D|nr:acyltransferase family protein [Leucobacter sp. UCD-THU]EYT52083.1 lipopolysaccharide modification acyltransferase [Leucobacter sp. UCD-THU]